MIFNSFSFSCYMKELELQRYRGSSSLKVLLQTEGDKNHREGRKES
jgi:hypothetical protein